MSFLQAGRHRRPARWAGAEWRQAAARRGSSSVTNPATSTSTRPAPDPGIAPQYGRSGLEPGPASACDRRARLCSSATSSPRKDRSARSGPGPPPTRPGPAARGRPPAAAPRMAAGPRYRCAGRPGAAAPSTMRRRPARPRPASAARRRRRPAADGADRLRRRAVHAQRRQRAEMLARGGDVAAGPVRRADGQNERALHGRRAADQLAPHLHQAARREAPPVAGQQPAQDAASRPGRSATRPLAEAGPPAPPPRRGASAGRAGRRPAGPARRAGRGGPARRWPGTGCWTCTRHKPGGARGQTVPCGARPVRCGCRGQGVLPYNAAWTSLQALHRKRSPRRNTNLPRFTEPFALDCGQSLPGIDVAYRTYGALNAARSNAVLVCHALTGDQYLAERHPITGKPGWWEAGGRAGPADRHGPVLRDLRQRARLAASAPPGRARSTPPPANRGARLPAGHHPRHGAGAEAAGGPFRHRPAVRRGGRLDGRHAGAGMGRDLSRPGVRRRADRHRAVPLGAEHRVP